jgi:hypothetical protein
MKHIPVIFRAALLAAVLASLAACSGGMFVDPGHGAGGASGDFDLGTGIGSGTGTGTGSGTGTGGSTVSKPGTLLPGATYEQVLAKLNDIIEYCEAKPSTANNMIKTQAQTMRDTTLPPLQTNWAIGGGGLSLR